MALRAQDLSRGAPGDPPEQLFFGELALSLATLGMRLEQCSDSRIRPPGSRTGGARRAPGEKPELTIVIPTLDATCDRVRACLKAVQSNTEIAHEIVIVDNGAPPQGFADPVNAGLRAARTPYVVVMNDDVEPLAGWWAPLRAALDAGAPVAFPLTVEGPMRDDFAAWCFAISADAIGEFGHAPGTFFDPTLVVWYQDTDLLLALRRAGRPLADRGQRGRGAERLGACAGRRRPSALLRQASRPALSSYTQVRAAAAGVRRSLPWASASATSKNTATSP